MGTMDTVFSTDLIRLQGIYYSLPQERRKSFANMFDNFYLLFSNLTNFSNDDIVVESSELLSRVWENIYDIKMLPIDNEPGAENAQNDLKEKIATSLVA